MITRYWRRRLYQPIAGGDIDWPFPFNQVAWWFNQVWAWLGGLWGWITDNIWNRLGDIINVVGASATWIRDRVSEMFVAVWTWINDRTNWLRDRVGELINGVINTVGSSAEWLRDRVGELVEGAKQALIGWSQSIWTAVTSGFESLPGLLHTIMDIELEPIRDATGVIGTVWDWIRPALPALGERIALRIDEDRELLGNLVAGKFDEIDNKANQRMQSDRDWFSSQIIDPWTDWLRSTTDQFIGGIQNVFKNLLDWAGTAWRFFAQVFNQDVMPAVQGAMSWIGEQFATIGRGAVSILENLFTGGHVADGDPVHAKFQGLVGQMTGVTGAIIAASVGGELLHPFKEMGLGRLALFLRPFTQYDNIINSYAHPIIEASLKLPTGRWVNNLLRPHRPEARDLIELYRRRFINRQQFVSSMEFKGFPDEWIDRWSDSAWREYSPTQILRLISFTDPAPAPDAAAARYLNTAGVVVPQGPAWYAVYKAARSGFEDIDLDLIGRAATLAALKKETAMWQDAARKLAEDGYIAVEEYAQLVEQSRDVGSVSEYRARALALSMRYEELTDAAELVIQTYAHGLLQEGEAVGALEALGLTGNKPQLRILRAKVGLAPRPRIAVVAGSGGIPNVVD